MSKEQFIAFMEEVVYRINDENLRDDLKQALYKFECGLPSSADSQRLRDIQDLKRKAVELESVLEWTWPRKIDAVVEVQIDPEIKSVEETVREIAVSGGGLIKSQLDDGYRGAGAVL